MNIYDALSTDHREFERLLDRLLEASRRGDDAWKDILDELRRGVVAHAHAEEAVLYNALREEDEAKDLVRHSYREHATAEMEMRALGAARAVDANWTSMVEKLSKDLRHHIEEEEARVFGAAHRVFTAEEARALGAAFVQMKTETARGGDSMVASTLDLVANLLPPKLSQRFRKHIGSLGKRAA